MNPFKNLKRDLILAAVIIAALGWVVGRMM